MPPQKKSQIRVTSLSIGHGPSFNCPLQLLMKHPEEENPQGPGAFTICTRTDHSPLSVIQDNMKVGPLESHDAAEMAQKEGFLTFIQLNNFDSNEMMWQDVQCKVQFWKLGGTGEW